MRDAKPEIHKETRRVQVSWNPVFREANRTEKRYRILMGSAASGKSMNTAQDYIKKLSAKRYRGANLLVVRKVEESNRNSTFAELSAAVRRLFGTDADRVWKINESVPLMECRITGARIIFRGMKDSAQREKLKSVTVPAGKITWIWCEEATELSADDFELLDDRLRGDLSGINKALYYQITLTFNPVSAAHWIKGHFFDRGDDDVFICRSTYRDNRFIDPSFLRRMERRRILDPEGYRVYGLGEWGETGGLIFTNWRVENFATGAERFDDVAVGQDFGFNHPNAILSIGIKDGNVYVRGELCVTEKDTSEIIRIAEGVISRREIMYCDSAEPDRILSWRKAGYRAVGVKKHSGSLLAGIDWLKGRRIFIRPECVNTIREISSWKWVKDEKTGLYTDRPTSVMDDAMAALRYGCSGWIAMTPQGDKRAEEREQNDVEKLVGGSPGEGYLF